MKLLPTEGTISWLFGYHSIFHSICVWLAWIKLYKKIPSFKETFCILIHDIGYCGMNYFTDRSHEGHEILGAKLAGLMFGKKYYNLVQEHRKFNCTLEVPDEYSHQIMPLFILRCLWLFERKRFMSPVKWKQYNIERWGKRMEGKELVGQWEDCYGYGNCSKKQCEFCTHHTAELFEPVNKNCREYTCLDHKNYTGAK